MLKTKGRKILRNRNAWWLKKQNVIGKIIKSNNECYGLWCGRCGEVTRGIIFDSETQKCEHCKNVIQMSETVLTK